MTTPPAAARGSRRGRLVLAGVSAVVVLVADQVTKHLAVDHLARGPVHLLGPLSLRLEYNTGVAFSLGAGRAWPVVLAVLALAGVLAWFVRGGHSTASAVALGMILGGALGNLADRFAGAHGGAVVDFVHTGFWPTFNLADASIVVGCGLLAGSSWRRAPGRAAADPPPSHPCGPVHP